VFTKEKKKEKGQKERRKEKRSAVKSILPCRINGFYLFQ